MALVYRALCSDRWMLSIVLIFLVPPCGCVSILCLTLAQRSRRTAGAETATTVCLERISDVAVAVALCFLLAAKFCGEQLHRAYLLRYLASLNCSEVGVNGTSSSPNPTVESLQLESPAMPLDDSAVRQRFALNDDLKLLQPPIDVELSVVQPNVNVLPLRRRDADSSSARTTVEH